MAGKPGSDPASSMKSVGPTIAPNWCPCHVSVAYPYALLPRGRYKSHFYRASGINSQAVKPEFLQHAQEARQHAEMVAARIVQLNGEPDFNPDGLTSRSRSEYSESATLTDMIREDLVSERIAVEFYSEIIFWLGDGDLTTRKIM